MRSQESGIVLVLFVMIIVAATTIIALVVDHSKQSLALGTLQRAADAAALAGAKRFNGKIQGWQNAKLAMVASIKQNPIHGVSLGEVATLELDQGIDGSRLHDDSGTPHSGNEGSTAKLHVKVERGVLWADHRLRGPATRDYPDGAPGYRFINLEERPQVGGRLPIPLSMRAYEFSNAVRVSVRLNSLATTFGRILGITEFRDLERTAIAVTHEELELPVAPIAIPYCALRLNTDPYAPPDEHTTPDLDLNLQCQRHGIATEADAKRELSTAFGEVDRLQQVNEILRRREGFTRYESYLRPVYAKYERSRGTSRCFKESDDPFADGDVRFDHNCKDVPLVGVMGVPSFQPNQSAEAKDVVKALKDGTTARVGMYFAPLTHLRDFAAQPTYRQAIAELINDPNKHNEHSRSLTFKDAFTDPAPDDKRSAKRNFPAIRTIQPPAGSFDPERRPSISPTKDLAIRWPTHYRSADGELAVQQLNMDIQNNVPTREPLDYTNPLCHDPAIPIDVLNTNQKDRHRVREMLAPVIAAGVGVKQDGKPVMYCNYEEVFENYEQNGEASTVAPVPETLPVIVGFVKIRMYDFNLADLDRTFSVPASREVPMFTLSDFRNADPASLPPNGWASVVTPEYSDGITKIIDRNPGELDIGASFFNEVKNSITLFEEDHGAWEECVNRTESQCDENRPNPKGGKYLGIPFEFLRCFDFRKVFFNPLFKKVASNPGASGGSVTEAIQGIPADSCSRPISGGLLGETESYLCIQENGPAKAKKNEYFNLLNDFFKENIKAEDFAHCLPREDLTDSIDSKDKNHPDYYVQPLDTTRAGFGCGGIAFMTDCGVEAQDPPLLSCNTDGGTCENTFFMAGGVQSDETSPALVKEDVPPEEQ